MKNLSKQLIIALLDIISVCLGGASLPYVTLGKLYNFHIARAVIVLIVSMILILVECIIIKFNFLNIIVPYLCRCSFASSIIVCSVIFMLDVLGKASSVTELCVFFVCLTLLVSLFILTSKGKIKKRKT